MKSILDTNVCKNTIYSLSSSSSSVVEPADSIKSKITLSSDTLSADTSANGEYQLYVLCNATGANMLAAI